MNFVLEVVGVREDLSDCLKSAARANQLGFCRSSPLSIEPQLVVKSPWYHRGQVGHVWERQVGVHLSQVWEGSPQLEVLVSFGCTAMSKEGIRRYSHTYIRTYVHMYVQ